MGADFRLDGRVALVTGSARNLGYEIARAYAEAGARVYLNGTDEERLWAAVDRLAAEGVRVHSALFDVTDEPAAAAQIERIFNECGRFDILVNNVGIRMREPITAIDSAGLRRMLDVHVVAAFALSRLVAPLMASSGYGRIVNLGSIGGERARRDDAAYIIAKGGLHAMTKALCAEFGALGITVNAILPGGFLTIGNENLASDAMRQAMRTRLPLGRPGDPPEIAGAAIFLASPAASYVSGVLLPVDGGALATA